jgi:hypothetical protein
MNGPTKTKYVFDTCAATFLIKEESSTVILLDGTVEKLTVAIRRDFRPKIKLPDCIVAATAILLGATLLTDDDSLKGLVWPGYTVLAI